MLNRSPNVIRSTDTAYDLGHIRKLSRANELSSPGDRARVLSACLRDSVQRLRGTVAWPAHGDIAERDDSDQPLVAIEHGQPPHLDVGHVAGNGEQMDFVEAMDLNDEGLIQHHCVY